MCFTKSGFVDLCTEDGGLEGLTVHKAEYSLDKPYYSVWFLSITPKSFSSQKLVQVCLHIRCEPCCSLNFRTSKGEHMTLHNEFKQPFVWTSIQCIGIVLSFCYIFLSDETLLKISVLAAKNTTFNRRVWIKDNFRFPWGLLWGFHEGYWTSFGYKMAIPSNLFFLLKLIPNLFSRADS